MSIPSTRRAPIHPAGWPFVAVAIVVTLLLGLAGFVPFLLSALVTAWVVYFFRDPQRVTPLRPGLVVSPADGRVVAVQTVVPDETLGLGAEERCRISVFLNVFNVHVNRSPVEGAVEAALYRPGAFVNASFDKASTDNERMALVLRMQGDHAYAGQTLGCVQIAGLVARRIVCDVKAGAALQAGQRYGIIRFGSRADIYLPPGMQPLVVKGQTMVGGETVLADASSSEAARQGEAR